MHILKILIELSTAIEKIHADNIMHRDIKPHNIMIGVDQKCKLGDFGFASHIDRNIQQEERVTIIAVPDTNLSFPGAGTLNYMSPE